MTEKSKIEKARSEALAQIEKNERNYKLAFYGAAAIEAAFLLAFILLADFSNRLHLLLLITTIATYTIVGVGLFALGAHVNRCVGRVLRGIELLSENVSQPEK